jgi:hypothetical protein
LLNLLVLSLAEHTHSIGSHNFRVLPQWLTVVTIGIRGANAFQKNFGTTSEVRGARQVTSSRFHRRTGKYWASPYGTVSLGRPGDRDLCVPDDDDDDDDDDDGDNDYDDDDNDDDGYDDDDNDDGDDNDDDDDDDGYDDDNDDGDDNDDDDDNVYDDDECLEQENIA